MASWKLVPCLQALRDEFDEVAPNRDHSSDGTIGDAAHQERSSNHNPDDTPGSKTPQTDSDSNPDVRALDVDASGPWPSPMTFDLAVNHIRKRHKSGNDNRLIEIIWNRHISTPSTDWNWIPYNGSNAHTAHAHFGASSNSSKEADTSPWGLVEQWGDDMDQATFNARMDGWANTTNGKKALERAALADVVDRLHESGVPVSEGNPNDGNPTMGVNSSLYYLARDAQEIKNALKSLTPPADTATAATSRAAGADASRPAAGDTSAKPATPKPAAAKPAANR